MEGRNSRELDTIDVRFKDSKGDQGRWGVVQVRTGSHRDKRGKAMDLLLEL